MELIFSELYQEKREEVERLRASLSILLSERDNLSLVVGRNIEMDYMLRLGGLEYKLYEFQCCYRRLKRKLELLQTAINRQECINILQIDSQLDEEFAQFEQNLEEQRAKMNSALERSKGQILSKEDAAELKTLYRKTVKALHPDLHPNATPEEIGLFKNAVEAYENGDLFRLRAIAEMVEQDDIHINGEDLMSKLTDEAERLRGLVDGLNAEIQSIREQYPFTLQKILMDENQITMRKSELNEAIEQFKIGIQNVQKRIDQIMDR